MLRPATPLSVLLFVAFVLLLLSVISTPIVKAIPLATYQGTDFGVFGYCKGSSCSGITVGYSTDGDGDFSLPAAARHSLSSILVVHPVAAFLTLVCFILAATAHLHSPSHSPRYLLALLILLLPTLLITLLAFLVDILLFVPNLKWGGWIVLAATILEVASGIVLCAMRRTLVSRKARKKRIAENPEMNGENFYSRQGAAKADSPPPLNAHTMAPVSNVAPAGDKLPAFATFDVARERQETDEDRIPLNNRSPSNKTIPSPGGVEHGMLDDGMDRFGGPGRGGSGGMRGGRGGRSYGGPRDEFGNPLPPSAAFGMRPSGDRRRDLSETRMGSSYSGETMNSYASRGRGRGGYPSRGSHGRGGQYGGGPGMNGDGRGIPMGPMAAGAGAGFIAGEMMDQRQQGPPPRYGNGHPPQGRPGQYSREQSPAAYGAQGVYGRRQSPGPPSAPAYGRRPSPGPPSAPGYGSRRQSPGPPAAPGGYIYGERRPSPGPPGVQRYHSQSPPPPVPMTFVDDATPIGQAVEMDATTGSPSPTPAWGPGTQLRDNDSDVQGLVGLQQGLQQHRGAIPLRQDPLPMSPSSTYSVQQDSYVPPRAAWAGTVGRTGTPPINTQQPVDSILQSPVSPIELPTNLHQTTANHNRNNSSDVYYEDVDPRFAAPDPHPNHTTIPARSCPATSPAPSMSPNPSISTPLPPPATPLPHQPATLPSPTPTTPPPPTSKPALRTKASMKAPAAPPATAATSPASASAASTRTGDRRPARGRICWARMGRGWGASPIGGRDRGLGRTETGRGMRC
ncbi:MAG: ph signal transduction [Lasallia pustulata]|uniref:Ph signal transduction n=1 Tax=Lasallia pustulata TaxID=136370 RepID=A0A5M8PJ30_9LECA|nr:MAG: ph signal transduction [Lasallia pustulata]